MQCGLTCCARGRCARAMRAAAAGAAAGGGGGGTRTLSAFRFLSLSFTAR